MKPSGFILKILEKQTIMIQKIVCIRSLINIHAVCWVHQCTSTWRFLCMDRSRNWMTSWSCWRTAMKCPKSICMRSMKGMRRDQRRWKPEIPIFGPWFACWLVARLKCWVCCWPWWRIYCCPGSFALLWLWQQLINYYKSTIQSNIVFLVW